MLKRVLLGAAIAGGVLLVAAWAAYVRDMRRAYERIEGRSRVISSPYGDIEYSEGGSGLPPRPSLLGVHDGVSRLSRSRARAW